MKWLDVLKALAVAIAALRELAEQLAEREPAVAARLNSLCSTLDVSAQRLEQEGSSEPGDPHRVRYSPPDHGEQ